MIAKKLTAEISAVCPIYGVSIGNNQDKQTWRIDFKSEATDLQKGAAQSVVDAFDLIPADAPVDQSDIDNLEKQMKALAMTFAQITNTPLATVRTIFRGKMEQLL